MDVFDAVRTVLAVRKYQDKPVPEDVVRKIVEAAHLTASSINLQPWHFIVVNDRDILQKMASMVRTGPYIAQAPVAVVVAIEKVSQYAESDASRAIQSMILTAWSLGVGSNWVGFYGLDGVKPLLGIPDTFDILAIVPFGYSTENKDQGKKNRKPLGDVVSIGKFGQPYQ